MVDPPHHYEPAFSLTANSSLLNLFTRVASGGRQLTVVCGAGISLDCGFPTWRALVNTMCEQIKDDDIRQLVQDDSVDLMRKVDYILGACETVANSKGSIVYKALYDDGDGEPTERVPGALTEYLAALAVTMGPRIRFVTTNFDNILESALSSYGEAVTSVTIAKAAQWWEAVARGERAVMHVHGIVTPVLVEEPVILSESDFREHGRAVQDFITEVLETSDVLFVGVSMADPNLIGPLSKKKIGDHQAYLITVPDIFPHAAWSNMYKYAVLRCKVLAGSGLETILMKSYSQAAQVITELGRAIEEPDAYMSQSEVRYGGRLKIALRDAYEHIGRGTPGGRDITDRLTRALQAPMAMINAIKDQWEDGFFEHHQIAASAFSGENFGLYLWLRVREEGRTPRYAITLVGSSVTAHQEPWSFQRVVPIEPGTGYYAAESIFQGKAISAGPLNKPSRWRSANAMPLYFRKPEDSFGSLPIGAVTLNSTRDTCDPSDHRSHSSSDCNPSAVTYFSIVQRDSLKTLIHAAGLSAIYDI